MILAIGIMHGCGPCNETHPQLQPNKVKVRKAVLAVNIASKPLMEATYNCVSISEHHYTYQSCHGR